jgi:hypothetical protein
MQYTNRDFKNVLMQKAQQWDVGKLPEWGELQQIKSRIAGKLNEINQLKQWGSAPSLTQRLIEARERVL